jgi:hypothetical protein
MTCGPQVFLVHREYHDELLQYLVARLPARKTVELCGAQVAVYEGGWIAAFHGNDRF